MTKSQKTSSHPVAKQISTATADLLPGRRIIWLVCCMGQGGWQGMVPVDSATPRFDLSQNDGTMSPVMTAAIPTFGHHHHRALPLDWEGLVCCR